MTDVGFVVTAITKSGEKVTTVTKKPPQIMRDDAVWIAEAITESLSQYAGGKSADGSFLVGVYAGVLPRWLSVECALHDAVVDLGEDNCT